MELKNGYKVLFEEVIEENGKKIRVFKATKDGKSEGADEIARIEIGKYKLIFEQNGKFYGSTNGLVAGAEELDFSKVFVEEVQSVSEVIEEPVQEEEPTEEPVEEEPIEE